MKILRLKLSNLNSLRGTNAIDFTQPPLANSGLFAITGPTGAGKTTILDAITLALYGRVARYGTTPSPDAVMSRHTGECSAEVEFTCTSGTFLSSWQLQRAHKKPDGKLQQAKRRVVAQPAGTVIAESIKDADAKILDLTGLDYDRFLRSVLLAQGDFATFLKAGPKERTDLLQQVTGTAIYQDISQAAFRRSADAELVYTALQRDHQAVPVLEAEQRSFHETTLAQHTRRIAELSTTLQTLSKRIMAAQRWLEIEKDAHQLEVDQTEDTKTRLEAVPALARLENHEKAAPFIADLTSLDRLATDLSKDRDAVTQLETKLPELERQVQAAESLAQQAQAALATEETRHTQLRALWNEVVELDKVLATARETLRQNSDQHTGFEKRVTILTTELATEQALLKNTSQLQTAAIDWLTGHGIDANLSIQLPEIQASFTRWSEYEKSITEAQLTLSKHLKQAEGLQISVRKLKEKLPPLLRELKTKLEAVDQCINLLDTASDQLQLSEIEAHRDKAREQRIALEKLASDATALRALTAEITVLQKAGAHIASELVRSSDDRKIVQQRREDVAKLVDAHRTALSFAEKVQSLGEHRTALQEDSPCPLCGSVHHPYATAAGRPSESIVGVRQNVAAAEAELKAAQNQFTEAEKRDASLLVLQKRNAADSVKQNTDHAALMASWNIAATPHNIKDLFGNEAVLLSKIDFAQADEKRRNEQVASVRAAELSLQKAKVAQQNAQAEIDRAQAEFEKQAALATQVQNQVPALEFTLAGHRQNAAGEKTGFAQLVASFDPTLTELSVAPKLIETLKERAKVFSKRQSDAQTLHANLGVQKEKCDSLSQQLTSASATVDESLKKVTAAKSDVETRANVRRDKFGDRTVAEAQREAELSLKTVRERASTTRADSDQLHQKQAAATQERDRLKLAITTRTAEHQIIGIRIQTAAVASGFANEATIRAALLPAAEVSALTAKRQLLDEHRVALTTKAAAIVAQRAALPGSSKEDAPQLVTLQTEHATSESENAGLQSAVGEIRAIIKNDDAQRARQEAVAVQIEAARRDHVRWSKLRALIGSADGSSFARFAQGLTLEQLTVLANHHLTQLNPRYSIRRAPDGEAGDLELEIVDHYQADVARPMRSLSGGESFLVSLALALGLSELASGRTTIESLFIDEGFGSLDVDTLETAMSALENLQAGGKTIGVISHVPAMQERIPTQINVTKESNGCSRIMILT